MIWILLKILGIVGLSYLLGKVTDKLIKALNIASRTFHVGHFEMTSIIVALATSLPEIMVSVTSSIQGSPALALGNAIGSNLVNLSLILGITAIVGKSLHFHSSHEIKRSMSPLILILTPFLFCIDGVISRIDGIILMFIYLLYVYSLIKQDKKISKPEKVDKLNKSRLFYLILNIIVQITIMVVSANMVVWLAKDVAEGLNLPVLFVGLFLVSVGTSLPELVFNIEAVKKREVEMSMGNIIGSCVANATLIVGVSALIRPIEIQNSLSIALPAIEQMFVLALLTFFVISKHRLDRWEGMILVFLFFYYTVLELLIK